MTNYLINNCVALSDQYECDALRYPIGLFSSIEEVFSFLINCPKKDNYENDIFNIEIYRIENKTSFELILEWDETHRYLYDINESNYFNGWDKITIDSFIQLHQKELGIGG